MNVKIYIDESKGIKVFEATYSTASTTIEPYISNPHLENWIDAKKEFYDLLKNRRLIVKRGQNIIINLCMGYEKFLRNLIKKKCKFSIIKHLESIKDDYNMKTENLLLYDKICYLDKIYMHYKHNGKNIEEYKQKIYNFNFICESMENVKNAWIFILNRVFINKEELEEQLKEFKDDFLKFKETYNAS